MLVLSLLLCVCFTTANETATYDAMLSVADKGETFDGGLQGLEIAPKVLTNVAYGNSRLSVWGHLDNPNRSPDKKQYFVMPVVMLLPESANCQSNPFSEADLMKFKVLMWNQNVASTVLTHMRLATDNPTLSSLQVTTLPMEQIRLTWASSAHDLSDKFHLNTHWRSYAKQENILSFVIVVTPAESCAKAVEHIKERPDSLGSLELQYVLHGTRASAKRIAVTGQHILQGKMYAPLQNKVDPTSGNVYLNSDDLNKLASEAVSNVVGSTTTDADYVDSGDTVSLAKLVYDGLATFKQSMAEMTPKMWESTFWQNEFARPDKLTSYFNKVITKDAGQNHTVRINEKEVASSTSASVSFFFKLFGGGAGASHSKFERTQVTEDDLRAWLRENHKEVQWTGEKFEVKSMDLYRLNTQQLNQQQDIAVTYVQIRTIQYTNNVPLSFPGETTDVGNGTSSAFAITKRLDALDAAISREAAKRSAADAKEATTRNAADVKEAAARNAADAEAAIRMADSVANLTTAVAANDARLNAIDFADVGCRKRRVMKDRLKKGEHLQPGDYILSRGCVTKLALECDGELVLSTPRKRIWGSNTVNSGAKRLQVQRDGNVVLYAHNWIILFATKSNTKCADATLTLQDDRNLVVYACEGVRWSTDTHVFSEKFREDGVFPECQQRKNTGKK